jgi:hypothetical protein
VLVAEAAELTSANLLLSVFEENGFVDYSKDIVGNGGAPDGNFLLSSESGFLLIGHILSNLYRKKVAFTVGVTHSFHVQALKQFSFVHEALEGESPTVSNRLKILSLLDVNIYKGKTSVFLGLSFSRFSDETLGDAGSGLLGEDALVLHVLKDEAGGFGESLGAGVDFELRTSGCFVGVRDAGEDWNDSSASLLVKTFDVAAFANLERSTDVALEELEAALLVQVLCEVAILRVWRDESNEHDHTSQVEQL